MIRANLVRIFLRQHRAAHHHFYLIADACGFERLDDVFLVHHRGRQKRRQADDVRIVVFDGLYHLFRVAVHAEVDNAKARALDHHLDEVFADIVQVALDRADDRRADGLHARFRQSGFQNGERRVHRSCRDENFGNEHFVILEFFADDAHADDQTLGENVFGRYAVCQLFRYESRQVLCFTAL